MKCITPAQQKDMKFSMTLSFSTGIFMLILKTYAYYITGSTAVLSDAAESIIHVLAVGFAAFSMWMSLKPADENHPYGHEKISFFSAGFEGAMIIIAAIFILYESGDKLVRGVHLQNIDSGMTFVVIATIINLFLGAYLVKSGKKYKSLILEANGKHILTDSWTSCSVIVALVLVKITHLVILDPLIAILTALNILITGFKLLRRSVHGLMDEIDPKLHLQITKLLIEESKRYGLDFHHLRHRVAGQTIFIEFHLLFPNEISLREAHEIATLIELSVKNNLESPSEIVSHLEPSVGHDTFHQQYGLKI